jgi:uncharacterized protein YbjT (DUF2867 family)
MKHLTEQAAGRILPTGATGYIGGRLLRKLEESGWPVRCMVRRPDCLRETFAGVTAAYYLASSPSKTSK